MRRRAALTEEIARLKDAWSELKRAAALLGDVAAAGAPAWAAALEARPDEVRELLPDHWRESWSRARLHARLDRLRALGNGDEHLARKRELAAQRETLLRELIRARTLMGLRPRMSESVRSALISFMTAVRRYGRGTGAQAGRWRRDMRESAERASRAAPVWVMPEYKIAEQLPSELGSFDLVVLDEASQCDVTSIASLARGARCLIVGDEKQVSPSSVGIPIERIDVLRAEFLADLPARNRIDQDTSIFDLACQAFPSSHLMLREHFRCVEPIIRFSTRFYQDRLIPLRVPRPSERFDPPLVDVHVEGAVRDGYLNRAEADVIAGEIASLVRDPAHAGRGIAVISLIGSKQAEAIEKRLITDPRVGTEAMKRHKIICGDARTLQGQERSIVFLSMVAVANGRGSVRAQSDRDIQQRMNVAMSRACDRLYLVRSLTLDRLKPDDIKRDVLLHFQDPMPDGGEEARTDLLELCESGFERDVCAELANAGYRVRPQVKAGPFRIDLVVEGENDRRLAIELDGDRWHGPDAWERDMRRQASLERAGWTFWRVFGSQWIANREHHWNDLVGTLVRLGIEPIGAAATGESFSELRRFVVEGDGVRRADGTVVPDVRDASEETLRETPVPGVVGSVDADAVPAADAPPEVAAPTARAATTDAREEATGSAADEDASPTDRTLEEVREDRRGVRNDGSPAESELSSMESNATGADTDTPDFYSDAYRPRLGDRLCEIVDERGLMDFDDLCRTIASEHGIRRIGHVIRQTIRDALSGRRALTSSRSTDHETVWPEGSTPRPCVRWIEPRSGPRPNWDSMCWPARIGLVAQTIADEPEDLHRAVVAPMERSKLTKRLRQEIDLAVGEVEGLAPDERVERSLLGPHRLADPYVPRPGGALEGEPAAESPTTGRELAPDAVDREPVESTEDETLRRAAAKEYPDDPSMQRDWYDEQIEAKRYMESVQDPQAKRFAVNEYPDDYSMQQYVYDEQLEAKRYMESATDGEARDFAAREHPNDHSMQQYVYEEQREAKRYLASVEDRELKGFAEREHPDDRSMQRYVYDEQSKAKRRMASIAASERKKAAVREYPEDYSMQQYVYENDLVTESFESAEDAPPEEQVPVLSDDPDADDPEGVPVPGWIRTLLDSAVYAVRSEAAGSRALTDAQMGRLLSALDRRDGRLLETSLSHALDVPAYRTGGLLAAARTVLNVDGVEILSVDDATSARERTVRLDRALLARQFRLGVNDSAPV